MLETDCLHQLARAQQILHFKLGDCSIGSAIDIAQAAIVLLSELRIEVEWFERVMSQCAELLAAATSSSTFYPAALSSASASVSQATPAQQHSIPVSIVGVASDRSAHNLPSAPKMYGREAELATILTAIGIDHNPSTTSSPTFSATSGASADCFCVAMCGEAGCGKTVLALNAAKYSREVFSQQYLMQAGTMQSLRAELARFARMHAPRLSRDASLIEAVQAALQHLKETDGWLLLLDDVGSPMECLDLFQCVLSPLHYTGREEQGAHSYHRSGGSEIALVGRAPTTRYPTCLLLTTLKPVTDERVLQVGTCDMLKHLKYFNLIFHLSHRRFMCQRFLRTHVSVLCKREIDISILFFPILELTWQLLLRAL